MQAPANFENLPLRDIHLPSAISWWPPALGWWLMLLGLIALIACCFWFWNRRQRRNYQRLALLEIGQLEQQFLQHQDQQRLITALSRLLRQMALLHFNDEDCAGLVGDDWLAFLDRTARQNSFSQGTGCVLATGPYLSQVPEIDSSALLTLCRDWIKRLPLAPKPVRRQR